MNKENPEPKEKQLEELEDEIKETIKKIKNRDEKEWPEKKYMELVRTEKQKDEEKEKEREHEGLKKPLAIYIVLCLMVLVAASLVIQGIFINKDTTKLPKEPSITKEGQHIINNIEFRIEDYYIEESALFLKVKVLNKSENGLYITVRSMYLVDQDGREYLPDTDIGEIPVDFFGKKIKSKTERSALIGFTDFPRSFNKTTLVVNNVSNAHNFVWDYMITLPDE